MSRPRCSIFIGTSLDGFIARPDGGIDWLETVNDPGEDYGFLSFFEAVDTMVVGRATHDVALGFPEWPYAGKRVVVLAHGPRPTPHGEAVTSGDPAGIVARLEREGARRVYVDGGAVVSQFLRAGLVDDLTVSILPIVLGDGIRLFQAPLPERRLVLETTRAYPSGIAQLRYRVQGP